MTEPFLEECRAFEEEKLALLHVTLEYVPLASWDTLGFAHSKYFVGVHFLALHLSENSYCWLGQKHNCGFLYLLHTVCHSACRKQSLESLCASGTKSRFFVSLS